MALVTHTCGCCQRNKTPSSFYRTPIHEKKEIIPICKSCINTKIKEYKDKTNSDKKAFWCVLAECGVPFIFNIYEKTETAYNMSKDKSKIDFLSLYLRIMTDGDKEIYGFWQSDVMLTDFQNDEIKKPSKQTKKKKVAFNSDAEIENWGRILDDDGNLDIDAYRFLNKELERYTSSILDMDANLENRYRDLAKCELRLRKANEKGEGNEISKAQDSLNKQLSLLGLDNFKSQNISEEKKFCEKRIALIEHFKPAECEDLKKYIDMVGYEREKAIPMRAIKNAIAGSRDYPDISQEEM